MPLELLPMTEADVPDYTDIMWESFGPGVMGLMYPDGYSKEAREHSTQGSLKAWRKRPDRIKKMKVVDTDLPDSAAHHNIVGVAEWLFYPKERTQEQMDQESAEAREGGMPPGANAGMMKDFFGAIGHVKKVHHGTKAHVRLHILATLPDHHRRGVGAMHMKWGFEEADKLGLEVWLEGSPMGTPLYTRSGFETVAMMDFDARKWGSKVDIPHAIMVRPARKL
ncbi:hypothetical protein LTR78_002401 [Recurvomyces mirabilis]|uniref:N-acetyltransferase domain-containing protein n=1 Tax=Recurvomyces mirabilis TaxID=574656 RepID=A0AAE1C4E8_9PEZI|nr:hypothetical protein LTR78_002401 [Recurvomyces mirabilis]KAK5157330.1 hypothetical protein LTS14_004095 [Recurvomyces mirabilis]